MAATVIDAFLTTLGLDGSGFRKGAEQVEKDRKKLDDSLKRSDRERGQREKAAAAEQKKHQKDIDEQGKKNVETYRKIRNEVLGLAALFTAGVGLKSFIADTINGAAGLGYLSANLSMSTESLSAWQRASERAGGTASGVIAQLKESADTLAQLRTGAGPNEGLQSFFRWGGNPADLKDGNTYLLARSRIIADMFKVDPTKAALVAKSMGVSEDQFDFMKQGPNAVMALVHAQEKNSVISAKNAADALELRNKWLDLTDSLQATTVKILTALLPTFNKFADLVLRLTGNISDNKDVVAEWVSKLNNFDWSTIVRQAKDFASTIKDITDNVKAASDAWDRWTNNGRIPSNPKSIANVVGRNVYTPAKIAADATERKSTDEIGVHGERVPSIRSTLKEMWARTMASFGSKEAAAYIRDITGKDDYGVGPKVDPKTQMSVQQKLAAMGWTKEQAAGITASFTQESNLDPRARNAKSGAYGIGQWLGSRVGDFKKWSGHDLQGSSLDEQLAFFQYEVTKGKEQDAGKLLRAARTAEDAARIHSQAYERPGEQEANIGRRQRLAGQLARGDRVGNAAQVGALPTAAGALAAQGNRTSTSTSETKIDTINIHTQATDAAGIATSLRPTLERYNFAAQANTGVN